MMNGSSCAKSRTDTVTRAAKKASPRLNDICRRKAGTKRSQALFGVSPVAMTISVMTTNPGTVAIASSSVCAMGSKALGKLSARTMCRLRVIDRAPLTKQSWLNVKTITPMTMNAVKLRGRVLDGSRTPNTTP